MAFKDAPLYKNIITKFWSFLQLTQKFYLYFTHFSDHLLSLLLIVVICFKTQSLQFPKGKCYLDIS